MVGVLELNDKDFMDFVEKKLIAEGSGEYEWENEYVERLYWLAKKSSDKSKQETGVNP